MLDGWEAHLYVIISFDRGGFIHGRCDFGSVSGDGIASFKLLQSFDEMGIHAAIISLQLQWNAPWLAEKLIHKHNRAHHNII